MHTIAPGTTLELIVQKADGQAYRWWNVTVESIDADLVVASAPVGTPTYGPGGGWTFTHPHRAFYWFTRPYNLIEVYENDGSLQQLYVNIASPARLEGHRLINIDYELDVVMRPGQPPEVVDEDEFAAAIPKYGYTPEFQTACRQAVAEVLALLPTWPVQK